MPTIKNKKYVFYFNVVKILKELSDVKYDFTVFYTVLLVFQINCAEAAE